MLYAEVAVEAARALDRETYSYSVPEGIDVVPGHRVTVPFGRRTTFGFVVSLGTDEPEVEAKPIAGAGAEPLPSGRRSLLGAVDRMPSRDAATARALEGINGRR